MQKQVKWPQSTSQSTKHNISLMIDKFDQFIRTNHLSKDQQDEYVRGQWKSLRKLIIQSPSLASNHLQYVQKIDEVPIYFYTKSQKIAPASKNLDVPLGSSSKLKTKKSDVILLDRVKLQQYAHDTIMLLKNNNKQLLKL